MADDVTNCEELAEELTVWVAEILEAAHHGHLVVLRLLWATSDKATFDGIECLEMASRGLHDTGRVTAAQADQIVLAGMRSVAQQRSSDETTH